MYELQGKVAIVTGAGRGIGLAIAQRLAQEGVKLVVNSASAGNTAACVEQIKAAGGEAVGVPGNVADPKVTDAMYDAAISAFGTLDIAVACAGITRDGMLHRMTDEKWDEVMAVNLNGTFYLNRKAAQHMRAQKSGRIVNISSISRLGNLGQANYAASKAGVVALTQTAAKELSGFGITCNAICPGFISTDMTAAMPEERQQLVISRIPAKRAGVPEDVANLVAFLCSEQASYITGEIIDVTGGMSVL